MKLLLVEDEAKLSEYLKRGLTEEGFIVDVVSNGLDGVRYALANNYDIIILDSNLPGLDGVEVLSKIRQSKNTLILILTARVNVADRVKGLQSGADDYLIKPFAFSELIARLQALMRRTQALGHVKGANTIKLGDLVVNLGNRRCNRAGTWLDLTAKEFNLLVFFLRRRGEVLSRETLAEEVWNMNYDRDMSVVDVTICRLRVKLDEPFSSPILHTVRGVGYILESRLK